MALLVSACTTNKDINVSPTKDIDDVVSPTVAPTDAPTDTVEDNNDNASEGLKKKISEFTEREKYMYENSNDTPIQDFTLPDFYGNDYTLSDYKGTIVILNFWAIGCPPCVNELPYFDEVGQKDGVQLITVAQKGVLGNEESSCKEFMTNFDALSLWDEKLDTMKLYPSQYYPHTYIIDRQGIVRFKINSVDKETLEELVKFCDEVYY